MITKNLLFVCFFIIFYGVKSGTIGNLLSLGSSVDSVVSNQPQNITALTSLCLRLRGETKVVCKIVKDNHLDKSKIKGFGQDPLYRCDDPGSQICLDCGKYSTVRYNIMSER